MFIPKEAVRMIGYCLNSSPSSIVDINPDSTLYHPALIRTALSPRQDQGSQELHVAQGASVGLVKIRLLVFMNCPESKQAASVRGALTPSSNKVSAECLVSTLEGYH